MTTTFIDKVKGFLLSPAESFKASRADSLGSAYRYYVMLLIIFSVLYAIVSTAIGAAAFTAMLDQLAASGIFGAALAEVLRNFTGFIIALDLFFAYLLFLVMLFGIFLSGFMYHAFVLLFGGEKGVATTVKTVMYANTPFLILGWIPYIAVIGAIWAFVLMVLGIKETQEMTLGNAFLIIIIPLLLVFLLVLFGAVLIAVLLESILHSIPFMG
jgi:hypothetical protein